MSSRCRERVLIALALLVAGAAGQADVQADRDAGNEVQPLRICADPDNAPFSQADGSGFENRIAALLAADLHRPLQYTWLPDRRGFVRKTLGAQLCDIIVGVPLGFGPVGTTHAYYRSGYVIVQRRSASPVLDLADPRLADLRIGVQLVGNDMAATPPAQVLAQRGIVSQVRGYITRDAGPPARRMVEDVASGALDVAFLWGPQAGALATHAQVPLRVDLLPSPATATPPLRFSIAMGTRPADAPLRAQLDDFLARRRTDIERVLDAYAVPRLPPEASP